MKNYNFIILVLVFSLISCGSSSDDNNFASEATTEEGSANDDISNLASNDDSNDEPVDNDSNKVWTVNEILSEPAIGGGGGEPKCGGEFGFKRCTCPEDVVSTIRYRPALAECNGNAAAILSGSYVNIFSVVVRDTQNRDRWPAAGFGGCSAALANSESPPNRCSAFKVQDSFLVDDDSAKVHCFGASGYSSLFSDVQRLTFKLKNVNGSSADPLERHCIYAGNLPLN